MHSFDGPEVQLVIKLAANISFMFPELAFIDRIAGAARAGFGAIEFLFPYDHSAQQLAEAVKTANLKQVLFNMPPGDWAAGERGLAIFPDRRAEFQDSVGDALTYAKALGTPRLHCMAGIAAADADPGEIRETFVRNLKFAAAECGKAGIGVLIEPINTFDVPGYYLNSSAQAIGLIKQAGKDNIHLQYDLYHMYRMGEDIDAGLRELISLIGHVQLSDHPGRHEPGTGEINLRGAVKTLSRLPYTGYVGCEYTPAGSTLDSLAWAGHWLNQ